MSVTMLTTVENIIITNKLCVDCIRTRFRNLKTKKKNSRILLVIFYDTTMSQTNTFKM